MDVSPKHNIVWVTNQVITPLFRGSGPGSPTPLSSQYREFELRTIATMRRNDLSYMHLYMCIYNPRFTHYFSGCDQLAGVWDSVIYRTGEKGAHLESCMNGQC